MILAYYGVEVSSGDIERFLLTSDQEGSAHTTEMARFAIRQGLGALCLGYNLALTDPSDAALSPSALEQKLRAEQKTLADPWYARMLESMIRSLEVGAKYRIVKPSAALLITLLQEYGPLLATVSYPALYDQQGDAHAGHTIVVSGAAEQRFWIIDPGTAEEFVLDANHLLFALQARKLTADDAYKPRQSFLYT